MPELEKTIINVLSVYRFYLFCHLKSSSGQLFFGAFTFFVVQVEAFVRFCVNNVKNNFCAALSSALRLSFVLLPMIYPIITTMPVEEADLQRSETMYYCITKIAGKVLLRIALIVPFVSQIFGEWSW